MINTTINRKAKRHIEEWEILHIKKRWTIDGPRCKDFFMGKGWIWESNIKEGDGYSSDYIKAMPNQAFPFFFGRLRLIENSNSYVDKLNEDQKEKLFLNLCNKFQIHDVDSFRWNYMHFTASDYERKTFRELAGK
jgi:hypothetical protein